MGTTEGLLSASALEVWRGGRCLIDALDFRLDSGQIALVVGPNGSGKTSLLRVLAGLSPVKAGRLSWNGRPVGPELGSELAYRGHLDGLKRELSPRENLEFYRDLSASRVVVDDLLAELDLSDAADRAIRYLSAGQRRRAALGTLKIGAARLWILDEPLTNLDVAGRDLVLGWIRQHLTSGGVAVVATHRADELAGPGSLMIEL